MENLALASAKFSLLTGHPTSTEIRIRRRPAFPLLSVPGSWGRIRRSRDSRFLAFSIRGENCEETLPRISKIGRIADCSLPAWSRIASNCRSVIWQWIRSQALYTARHTMGVVHAQSSFLNHKEGMPIISFSGRVHRKSGMQKFASISSSNSNEISTASTVAHTTVPPPPSYFGSPLFWVGVGVALSALFSVVATRVKQYAMQQAFKTMMSQATAQNGQFSNELFPAGSTFPFPSPPNSSPTTSSSSTSQPVSVIDLPPTKVEEIPPTVDAKEQTEKRQKRYAFVDVSPEEVLRKSSEYTNESEVTVSVTESPSGKQVSQNGAAIKKEQDISNMQSETRTPGSVLSVEALEKMMEDPNVQKMVYPYLPEEMRNPTTFKWMLQNPQYRQQLQDMLTNMGGNGEWDNRMLDTLKNFDLSSPEIKQQFNQIGLTPEEVISKIMANPDVALAFQNPKVQAAIMDCSQNPLSIAKYQNDKEVMDVFNKISELFPGVTGGF